MTFKVQVASIDLMAGMANVVAFDQATTLTPGRAASFNLQSPFAPSGGADHEKEKVIAAAKVVLQRIPTEI
jgi:hypothetical protein